MITMDSTPVAANSPYSADAHKFRVAAYGDTPAALAEIFEENVNMAVWRREPSNDVQNAVDRITNTAGSLMAAMTVSPKSTLAAVSEALGIKAPCALSADIAELVEMFCDLLGLERAGLRLRTLDSAMCPRFHVDRVPCRLITTYQGGGTEWLEHTGVDRSKLGLGNAGKPDSRSGVVKTFGDIQQLDSGDVALMKGELWEGNEGAGLVHRSPAVGARDKRLLLTLDVSS
ncbi:MAG: DUF1826 domain-containing protein [Pseudomonadota bacterium]